jgi:2-oxoglutarate ferredoxin oxidoreductase subunit beta
MIYGKAKNKGLRVNTQTLSIETVTLGQDGITEKDLLVHDEKNRTLALLLTGLKPPAFPEILGVIYCDPAASYETAVKAQDDAVRAKGPGDLDKLMRAGNTWQVS